MLLHFAIVFIFGPAYIIWEIYCNYFRREPDSLLEVIMRCDEENRTLI